MASEAAVYAVRYWTGRVEALFSTADKALAFIRGSTTTRYNASNYEVVEYPVDAAYASVVCPSALPEAAPERAAPPSGD